jgi:hypothetical protein
MTELETLQVELNTINQQIQAIMNPRIDVEKTAMTEEQKIQQIRKAIIAANTMLNFIQNR